MKSRPDPNYSYALEQSNTHTVLVVEDEQIVRMLIVEYLRDCGYHVLEACDAGEAMAATGLEPSVSVVFSDIRTFGRVWSGTRESLDSLHALKKLGPEPFDISAREFAQRLRSKNSRLKSLLLNQEFLAGVGNIYADESLFGAGLHPLSSASRVSGSAAVDRP